MIVESAFGFGSGTSNRDVRWNVSEYEESVGHICGMRRMCVERVEARVRDIVA